ncbi:hypothetical protein BDFB_012812 [Asbolus verrucosus]|uniref:HTH Tnp Tc3 2 domain containing protein n=1 Tax=Asbolus verrucosus TaxID=1661398 RepID=A0A482W167_ASBVE|nr:hypothetical protein BDFB_012812 [Asbolus verrucosus]
MMLSLRNRHMTAVETRNHIERVIEVNVSERAVRSKRNEANLSARRPATETKLLKTGRVARLNFTQERLN